MDLSRKTCEPCRGGIPPMTRGEAERHAAAVPGWALSDAGDRIRRRFEFGDFAATLRFVNRLGELAEAEGHHPDICFGWGYAEVTFFTHKIAGLHENDFIMAAKVDRITPGGPAEAPS